MLLFTARRLDFSSMELVRTEQTGYKINFMAETHTAIGQNVECYCIQIRIIKARSGET